MTDDQDLAGDIDPSRPLNRARAALREAAEFLDDAARAGRHPSVGVASALAHVAAARKAIGLYGTGAIAETPARDAA